MKRTDTHAPSTFDPAEYEEIGYFDNHHEDGGMWVADGFKEKDTFSGNYEMKGKCDHCGAGPLRYGVIFYHKPTDTTLVTGEICASKLNLSSRTQLERRANLEQAIRKAKRANWATENADNAEVAAWFEKRTAARIKHGDEMQAYNEQGCVGAAPKFPFFARYDEFVDDVDRKLTRYGSLSEKQTAAILRVKHRIEENEAKFEAEAARVAQAEPLVEGRYEIEGELVSTKWVDNDFGGALKMLVKLDDGNKVWGTCPSSINPDGVKRVKFTAAVERSRDDDHFGFFKRPTKAEVTEASDEG